MTAHPGRHGPVRRDRQPDRRHAGAVRHPDGADSCTSAARTSSTTSPSPATAACPTPQLRDEVAAALPPGFEALDDEQIAAENQDQLQQGLSFITTFLLVFAAVALVVGTFLILNTFSIIVAQRTRELALFRALGASKSQVTRSVLLEALVVGLVGSTVGLALGFALAAGLQGAVRRDRPRPRRRPAWSSSRARRSPPTRSACW